MKPPWEDRSKIAMQFALHHAGDHLTKIATDIWVANGPVAEHYDDTARGLVVYGLVLINEIDLELHYRGGIFPLKPGDAYCINGHQDHAALYTGGGAARNGLFAARVWDVPPGMSLAQFVEQASTEPVEWM
jgi:hypothetical protein